MKKVRTYRLRTLLVACCAAGLIACTSIRYETSVKELPYTDVDFRFDWTSDKEIPDSMAVLMSRIRNTVHYGWFSNREGVFDPILRNPSVPDSLTSLKRIDNGEYYLMAFNYEKERFIVPELDGFVKDPAVSMKDIKVAMAPKSLDDIYHDIGYKLPDMNPTLGFVENSGPLYVSVQKESVYPHNDTLISVTPGSLTQRLKFKIHMNVEEGMTVNSVWGDFSGIPGAVRVMTSETCDSTLYRMLFKMEPKSEGTPFEENGIRFTPHVYEGEIHVFGIVPSRNKELIVGPGILQLMVYADAPDELAEPAAGNGNAKPYKLYRAALNLKSMEEVLDMMLPVRKEGPYTIYRQKKSEADFEIEDRLQLRMSRISGSNDEQGVDSWVTDEDLPFVDDDGTEL